MRLSTFGWLCVAACGGGAVETQSVAPSATASASASASASAPASASASAPASAAPPIAGKPIAVPQLRLAGVGPGVVGAPNVHAGAGGAMSIETDAFTATVGAAGPFDPKTLDQAREHAKSYSGRNVHAETLADGWAVTFENEAFFFANVYRTLGGKPYFCSATQPKAEQRDRAVLFCKSLTAK